MAHIRARTYHTPTFLIHSTRDDLDPFQQSERTFGALRGAGVDAELVVLDDVEHLFDIFKGYHRNTAATQADRNTLCKLNGNILSLAP